MFRLTRGTFQSYSNRRNSELPLRQKRSSKFQRARFFREIWILNEQHLEHSHFPRERSWNNINGSVWDCAFVWRDFQQSLFRSFFAVRHWNMQFKGGEQASLFTMFVRCVLFNNTLSRARNPWNPSPVGNHISPRRVCNHRGAAAIIHRHGDGKTRFSLQKQSRERQPRRGSEKKYIFASERTDCERHRGKM